MSQQSYHRSLRHHASAKAHDRLARSGYADGGSVTPEINAEGSVGTSDAGASNDIYSGGRAGLNFKIDHDSDLSLGARGEFNRSSGSSDDGDWKQSRFDLTGADASYRKGDTTFGLQYNRTPTGARRKDKSVVLSIGKKF